MNRTLKIIGKSFLFFALPISLSAGPMISVDSANFDLGTIREGSVKIVKHTYKIKNTGDSVLVIQQVRPG